jgi:membrane associated rhomboid family serine protease
MIPLYDTQPRYTFPIVTLSLIALNVIVFYYEFSLEPYYLNYFISRYGIVPERFAHAEPWSTIFTSMFLHGGFMHLIGNMWILWLVGDNVEDLLGHVRFLLFYLACGVIAAFVHIFFNLESQLPTIGASGAIAGVMGAYAVKFPRSRVAMLIFIFIFFTVVDIPAMWLILYWFVIQLFSGIGSIGYSHLSQGGPAFMAHVGGFLAGILLIQVMAPKQQMLRRNDYSW